MSEPEPTDDIGEPSAEDDIATIESIVEELDAVEAELRQLGSGPGVQGRTT